MSIKTLKILATIFVLAILVNLAWEVSHSLLYDWSKPPLENTVSYYIPRIIQSTLGDGMYIVFIFLINSLFRRNLAWVSRPEKRDYISLAILGLAFAIFIEVKAHILNLWSYNQYMPQIFGIGLTPLIQLSLTSILVLWIMGNFRNLLDRS